MKSDVRYFVWRDGWRLPVARRRSNRHPAIVAELLLLLVATGCGGGELSKVVVEGQATFNGKKVLNGDIRFIPAANGRGSVAEAPIVDGSYKVTSKGGVPIGTHRVVLRAFVLEEIGAADGGSANDDLLTTGAPSARAKPSLRVYNFEGRAQFLPPEYNERSGLVIKVTGDDNPQVEDFAMRGGA